MQMSDAEALYGLFFTQLIGAYGDMLGRPDGVALVGIRSGGAWLAERLAADIAAHYAGEPTSIDTALTGGFAEAELAAPDSDLAVAGAALAASSTALAPSIVPPTSLVPSRRHVQHDDDIIFGIVNVSLHRDDFASKGLHGDPAPTQLPFDVGGSRILLIDDVLYTGRTIRAALNELYDYGRPASVELAVLVDRGGRELPFNARFAAARVDIPADRALVMTREPDGRFSFDTASRVD